MEGGFKDRAWNCYGSHNYSFAFAATSEQDDKEAITCPQTYDPKRIDIAICWLLEVPRKTYTFLENKKYLHEDMFVTEQETGHTLHNWIELSSSMSNNFFF